MKCPNCGFEAENNAVCPICGETMPEENSAPVPQMNNASSNTNPYQQPAEPQYNAPQQPANNYAQPYENPYAQPYENPYAQQPAEPKYSPQHYENPYSQQPQEPVYQQPAETDFQQPVEPQYNAHQQPNPNFQNAPSNNYTTPAPPKKSNGAAIVITAVVASVVAVGIAISVLSVTLFKNSIYNIGDRYDDFYDPEPYYPYEDYTFEDFSDNAIHKIGESFEFDYGQLTLKNVEIAKKYSDGKCQYAFTVEVKNVTTEEQTYALWYDLLDSKYNFANSLTEDDTDENYLEHIYTEGDHNDYGFTLKAGESTEFVIYYKGMENHSPVYPEITLEDYEYYNYTGTTHYEVDLSKLTEAKNAK